jgi:hypothetical protein
MMGPRELKLREQAAESFPPDGVAYFADGLAQAALRDAQLWDALEEACNGWEDTLGYKGTYLTHKHGDAEDIARLRALLNE